MPNDLPDWSDTSELLTSLATLTAAINAMVGGTNQATLALLGQNSTDLAVGASGILVPAQGSGFYAGIYFVMMSWWPYSVSKTRRGSILVQLTGIGASNPTFALTPNNPFAFTYFASTALRGDANTNVTAQVTGQNACSLDRVFFQASAYKYAP